MHKLKKWTSLLLAGALMLIPAGCTQSSSSWLYQAGDYTITSGQYLSYLTDSTLKAKAMLDTEKTEDLFSKQLEGKNGSDWIQNDAENTAKENLGVQIQCNELGITLSNDEQTKLSSEVNSKYQSNNQNGEYEARGISKDSYEKNLEGQKLYDMLMNHYYGSGGTEEVPTDQINDYIAKHLASYKTIEISKMDTNTNKPAEGDKYNDLKKQAQGYGDEINGGKSIDDVNKEYQTADGKSADSVQDLSENLKFDDDTTIPVALRDVIFNTAQVGGGAVLAESEKTFYIVQRYDAATEEHYNTYHNDGLKKLKTPDFHDKLMKTLDDHNMKENKFALRKYTPKKLQSIVSKNTSSQSASH